ncbi:MAG: PqqD family protein [Vicinamibacterales bacterium]
MASPLSLQSVVVASSHQVSRALGDDAVILDLNSGMYFGLNAVGARVWALLEHPRQVAEIRSVILDEFDVDHATCERDLLALLEELSGKALIEIVGHGPAPGAS